MGTVNSAFVRNSMYNIVGDEPSLTVQPTLQVGPGTRRYFDLRYLGQLGKVTTIVDLSMGLVAMNYMGSNIIAVNCTDVVFEILVSPHSKMFPAKTLLQGGQSLLLHSCNMKRQRRSSYWL